MDPKYRNANAPVNLNTASVPIGVWKFRETEAPITAWPLGPIVGVVLMLQFLLSLLRCLRWCDCARTCARESSREASAILFDSSGVLGTGTRRCSPTVQIPNTKQQVVAYTKSIDVKTPTPDRTLVVQAHAAKKVLEAGIRMQTVKHYVRV